MDETPSLLIVTPIYYQNNMYELTLNHFTAIISLSAYEYTVLSKFSDVITSQKNDTICLGYRT